MKKKWWKNFRLRRRRRRSREKQVENTLLGSLLRALGDFVEFFLAHHVDGRLHQVSNHGFDVAAYVSDFGVLRCFHFDERTSGQAREAARDFRFADSGGANHQNVFRQDIFGHLGREFLPAHAIAQRDGNRALCGGLAHDVLVQFDDDFPRCQLVKRRFRCGLRFALVAGKIDHHLKLLNRESWHS